MSDTNLLWLRTDRGVADLLGFLRERGFVNRPTIATRYDISGKAADRLMQELNRHGLVIFQSPPGLWGLPTRLRNEPAKESA